MRFRVGTWLALAFGRASSSSTPAVVLVLSIVSSATATTWAAPGEAGAAARGEGEAEFEVVDRIVAIIDREVITLSEAERAQAFSRMRRGEGPASSEAAAPELDLAGVVERLIETRLVERELQRFTAEPLPSDLVDEALSRIREEFGGGDGFTLARESAGLEEEDVREELGRQLAVNRYLEQRFRALVSVTPEEIETYFHDELVPELSARGASQVPLAEVSDQIRAIVAERKFNARVEEFLDRIKANARIRRYVW